jgi:hypothetical protein
MNNKCGGEQCKKSFINAKRGFIDYSLIGNSCYNCNLLFCQDCLANGEQSDTVDYIDTYGSADPGLRLITFKEYKIDWYCEKCKFNK